MLPLLIPECFLAGREVRVDFCYELYLLLGNLASLFAKAAFERGSHICSVDKLNLAFALLPFALGENKCVNGNICIIEEL